MSLGSGKVIYVGSIPYDQTEEQVLDVFRSVGPVAKFRLVFDKETGKSKGFGFVEYHDAETAASAVRNLNGYQIGNRSLRVDFTHEGIPIGNERNAGSTGASGGGSTHNSNINNGKQQRETPVESTAINFPPGTPLANGLSAAEAISKAINSYPKPKILELITDLQELANQDPDMAEQLFKQCPQLSYAAVQSLLALGLVDSQGISAIIDGAPAPAGPAVGTKEKSPETSKDTNESETVSVDPEQAALIKQVMLLNDEELAQLPEEQREALRVVRERVRSGQIVL